MTDQSTEQMIQDKGLNAPRITPSHIDSVIEKTVYHNLGGTLTVCVLYLKNGFKVTGESACASPENFDEDVGRKVALEEAKSKIWMLEGYLLKQRLYEQMNAG